MATPRKNTTTTSASQRAKASGAKVPQDRQTASDDVSATVFDFNYHGTVYEVDADHFDNIEFIETVQQSITRGLRILLGREQHEQLIEQIKAEDKSGKGIARLSVLQEFFEDLQEKAAPLVGA